MVQLNENEHDNNAGPMQQHAAGTQAHTKNMSRGGAAGRGRGGGGGGGSTDGGRRGSSRLTARPDSKHDEGELLDDTVDL